MQTYRTSGEVSEKGTRTFYMVMSPKPQQGPCLLLQKEHICSRSIEGRGASGGRGRKSGVNSYNHPFDISFMEYLNRDVYMKGKIRP